jgi:DNA mismatch endonuclease (patch repair protein)
MADRLTKEERSKLMSHIRSVNTKPEVALRHALWQRGFRYRVNVKNLPGSPDIVLSKHRTVVFVHGCFWHAHKGCKISHLPQTNTEFWLAKVTRNQERDQEVWRQLEAKGWAVVIVWECELAKSMFNDTVEKVAAEIYLNGKTYRQLSAERRKERERRNRETMTANIRRLQLLQEIKSIKSTIR